MKITWHAHVVARSSTRDRGEVRQAGGCVNLLHDLANSTVTVYLLFSIL